MAVTDTIEIDFQIIPTLDPRYISIADYSTWGQLENRPSIVEVIIPGEELPKVHYFKQGQLNIINSFHLGITCLSDCGEVELVDLPDGIYNITVKGSPEEYNMTRSYLRTTLTKLELDKLYINLDFNCKQVNSNLLDLLTEIEFLLKAAESNTRFSNNCKAQELLFKAQDILEKAKKCESCVDV